MKVDVNIYRKISQCREYLEFFKEKYGTQYSFEYYYNDIQIALKYVLQCKHQKAWLIKITDHNKLMAHSMIIGDDRLTDNHAIFGFFECTESKPVFDLLWDEVRRLATLHGFRILKGPISGTTWHPYRVVKRSSGNQFFNSEPITENYYYNYLCTAGKCAEIGYHSGRRTNFDHIIKVTSTAYNQLTLNGYSVETPTFIDTTILHKLYILSSEVFRTNYGFTHLSMDEFLDLYNLSKLNSFIGNVYLARKEGEVLGFCSTIRKQEQLIIKTIAVLPALHGIGLGNALVHKVHYDAKRDGITEIIYALVRNDNQVKNFPRSDVEIFREYACFDFRIY